VHCGQPRNDQVEKTFNVLFTALFWEKQLRDGTLDGEIRAASFYAAPPFAVQPTGAVLGVNV